SLTILDLESKSIDKDRLQHLDNVLQYNPRITTLNLSDNALNDSGIKHVTNVLQQNTTIKTLHLRKTGIGFGCSRYARYNFPSAPSGLFAPPVASTGGGNLVNFRSPGYLGNLLKINSVRRTILLSTLDLTALFNLDTHNSPSWLELY
ncbi:unnamed protein product, partial [Rotaria sp. Silwood1]